MTTDQCCPVSPLPPFVSPIHLLNFRKLNSVPCIFQNLMNSQFNDLPNPDLFNSFVTWPGLEDALKGIRQELSDQTRPKSPVAVSKLSVRSVPLYPVVA